MRKKLNKSHEAFIREEIDKINMFKTPLKGELIGCNIGKKYYEDKNLDEEND